MLIDEIEQKTIISFKMLMILKNTIDVDYASEDVIFTGLLCK